MQLTLRRDATDFDPSLRGTASTGITLSLLGHDVSVDIRGVPRDSLDGIESAENTAEARLRDAAAQAASVPEAMREKMFRLLLERL